MFTHQQYLAQECSHEQYYAQFVTPELREAVRARFGAKPRMSGNLSEWDGLFYSVKHLMSGKMNVYGDYLTLAGGVCILKEAARQNMAADESPEDGGEAEAIGDAYAAQYE